jgi:hypothetical protein
MAGAKSAAPKAAADGAAPELEKVPTDGTGSPPPNGNDTPSSPSVLEVLVASREAEERERVERELREDQERVAAEQKAIADQLEAERARHESNLRRMEGAKAGVTRVKIWGTGAVLWNGRLLEAGTVVEIDHNTHSHDEFLEQVEAGRFLPPDQE